MKRRFRLTRSADFQRLRRSGNFARHPLLVMVVSPNFLEISRFGVVAGRSIGKAVQRNRAKRLLRHALQPFLASFPPGWDILLIARQPLVVADLPQVQTAVGALLARVNISLIPHERDDL